MLCCTGASLRAQVAATGPSSSPRRFNSTSSVHSSALKPVAQRSVALQPAHLLRNTHVRRTNGTVCLASRTPQLTILKDLEDVEDITRPLLLYLPGSDGTGQAFQPQMAKLKAANIEVRCLHLPAGLQADWDQMTIQTLRMVRELLCTERPRLTLVAESFGACLALRVAQAAPELVERLVLVNPATCFEDSLAGVTSLVSATNLTSLFPARLYNTVQEILLPLLVEKRNAGPDAAEFMQNMMDMQPPTSMVPVSGFPELPAPSRSGEIFHAPARTASFRMTLMRDGNLPDEVMRSIEVPTLLLASVQDRIFPSVAEATRLQSLLPHAHRVLLPSSGHTALLERDVDLLSLMADAEFLPTVPVCAEPVAVNGEAGPGPSSRAAAQLTELNDVDLAWAEQDALMRAWRVLVAPVVLGEEHIPDPALAGKRPILFVGNHTRYGLYDLPHLLHELYLRGLQVRGLAHPAHWKSPLQLGQFFEKFGAVPATPRSAYRALRNKDAVLLFPGGGREVCKGKDESYQLMWGDKPEFVRMAVKLNAIIVPFSAMGGDDAYDIAFETEDVLSSPVIGDIIKGTMASLVPELDPSESFTPIAYFPGTRIPQPPTPFPMPKLERLYFRFLEPIDTADVLCDLDDMQQCQELYNRVKADVLAGLEELKEVQAMDENRNVTDRVLAGLQENIVPPVQSLLNDT